MKISISRDQAGGASSHEADVGNIRAYKVEGTVFVEWSQHKSAYGRTQVYDRVSIELTLDEAEVIATALETERRKILNAIHSKKEEELSKATMDDLLARLASLD